MEVDVLPLLKVAMSVLVKTEVLPGKASAPVLQLEKVLSGIQLASCGVALQVPEAAEATDGMAASRANRNEKRGLDFMVDGIFGLVLDGWTGW